MIAFNYIIECDKQPIAMFTNPSDRDICLEAMQEYYDDAEFVSIDKE